MKIQELSSKVISHLYNKCEEMESTYSILVNRKYQIRYSINLLIDKLNDLYTLRIPLHDKVLYDKLIYELKDCVEMKDNGQIIESSKYYNNFCPATIHKLDKYASQSPLLAEIHDLLCSMKQYIEDYGNAKKYLRNLADSLLLDNRLNELFYLLYSIVMISERPIEIYDDTQNIILDGNIQLLKKLIHQV